ncbi:hypothetical protein N7488_010497 [Penicillium malachiteum]|nr:hypothetical protein N7488_010497 [Penicillium malachiteum]
MPARSLTTYVSPLRTAHYQYCAQRLISYTNHLPNSQQSTTRAIHFPTTFKSQPVTQPPRFPSFSTSSTVMSSDDAYMAFLNKANSDLNAGHGSAQGGGSVQTQAVDTSLNLPASLKNVEVYYVSDTDEPFEPVLLRWKGAAQGKWPSADDFSSLISPNNDISQGVSTLSTSSFDPKKQYSAAIQAVLEAVSSGSPAETDLKVYCVELTSTKLEYFVLALDSSEGGRVVGLRAKSVES